MEKKNKKKKAYQKPTIKKLAIGCVMLPTYAGD